MDNDEYPYEMPAKIAQDLKKVNFDFENYTDFRDSTGFSNYPVGYRELTPGFHVFFVNAGGDWEFPICFILYWGEKSLRAYISSDGNAWNKKEKCAYGSEYNEENEKTDQEMEAEVSEVKIINDILNRITKK